jgi:RNA polymerase-binding transcription factor DksA
MRICFSSGVIFLENHISNSPSVDLRLRCGLRGHERRLGDTVFRRYLSVRDKSQLYFSTDPPELLEEVEAALGRVSGGTYGTCEICKQPIEADRLHAHPLVRSCASHLATKEQESLPVSRDNEQPLPRSSMRAALRDPTKALPSTPSRCCSRYAAHSFSRTRV